ncbi:hypothetical protein SLS59_007757 [Nothophoma quercina]|uniref:Uncharacterized protein n=1 Tax=Nothophoma quercina TaxID=749835 RepID=A0ABR3QX45_9PLEO
MVKSNRWNPLPTDFTWPEPRITYLDPALTPRTDAPGTPFPFLSLPRELRDQVYTHTFNPEGIRHRSHTRATTLWSHPKPKPPTYLNLILTSRQIHLEASAALFQACTIEIAPRHSQRRIYHANSLSVTNFLRLFPSAPATLITAVHKQYYDYTSIYRGSPETHEIDELWAMWEHMISEAYVLKEFFPRLKTFKADWSAFEKGLERRIFKGLEDLGESDADRQAMLEKRVDALVQWMRVCAKNRGMQVVPPEWLQIEWDEGPQPCRTEWWYQSHVRKKRVARFQSDVLKLAQRRFAKERAVMQDELEDSGRKWLEEWSKGSKPKRKKWQVPAVDV